jgi:hypothetical protein
VEVFTDLTFTYTNRKYYIEYDEHFFVGVDLVDANMNYIVA